MKVEIDKDLIVDEEGKTISSMVAIDDVSAEFKCKGFFVDYGNIEEYLYHIRESYFVLFPEHRKQDTRNNKCQTCKYSEGSTYGLCCTVTEKKVNTDDVCNDFVKQS